MGGNHRGGMGGPCEPTWRHVGGVGEGWKHRGATGEPREGRAISLGGVGGPGQSVAIYVEATWLEEARRCISGVAYA